MYMSFQHFLTINKTENPQNMIIPKFFLWKIFHENQNISALWFKVCMPWILKSKMPY